MNNQRFFCVKHTIFILLFVPSLFYCLGNGLFKLKSLSISGLIQEDSHDIQSTFDKTQDSSLPSTANDLLNILQRIEAMNSGTEPTDAIDDALKAFEREDTEEAVFDSQIPVNN